MQLEWTLIIMCLTLAASSLSPLIPKYFDDTYPIPIPGFTWHQVFELAVLPISMCSILVLYNDLLTLSSTKKSGSNFSSLVLMIFPLSAMLQGQGIHLAANCIHDLISPGNEWDPLSPNFQKLTYFLDETLGHHLVFAGLAIAFFMLLWAEKNIKNIENRPKPGIFLWMVLQFTSLVNGFVWFVSAVEGQTVLTLSLPVSIILVVDGLLVWLQGKKSGPIGKFMHWGSALSVILMLGWGYHFNWQWPEFRVLGWGPIATWLGQFYYYLQTLIPK